MSLDYRFGNAELRSSERALLVDGAPCRIGARALDLLVTLVEGRERVVPKSELLDKVWPGLVVEENNLQVHISSLRKVLGANTIATVPGRGYRFTADVEPLNGPAAAAASTPDREPQRGRGNLPAVAPALFGRTQDIAAVQALLHSQRVVTIAGGAGIGKTVLAQAVARAVAPECVGGAWLVDLSGITDASLVPGSIAAALRLPFRGVEPAEALAERLPPDRLLLVLDNCEHVAAEAAAVVRALHDGAPQASMLLTSQEPMRLPCEQVYRLGALEVPDESGSAADLRRSGAVALFEARARQQDPSFEVADDNAGAVADICRRLDGIPLAIELAAARLPLFGIQGLRRRLDERFRVLTTASRAGLPRHHALRTALEWSHGLLDPLEQVVFRRLAVFAGGFRIETAEFVVAGDGVPQDSVLAALAGLQDKSLLVAERGAEPRYRLLESTRALAQEKLQASGEASRVRERHARAVLAIFEQGCSEEYILTREERLQRYTPEIDNARAALDWAVSEAGDRQLHVALCGAAAWLWHCGGAPQTEVISRLEQAAGAIDESTPVTAAARVFTNWALLCAPGRGPREIARARRAVELLEASGEDPLLLFGARSVLLKTLAHARELDAARAVLADLERDWDPQWPPSTRLRVLAARAWLLQFSGQHAAAGECYREVRELAEALGDRDWAIQNSINEEQALAGQGRWQEAIARGRAMLQMLEQHPTLRAGNEMLVTGNLFMAYVEAGELEAATALGARCYRLFDKAGQSQCLLESAGQLAFRKGALREAAHCLGLSDARYAAQNRYRDVVEAQLRDRLAQGLAKAVPGPELARWLEEGASCNESAVLGATLGEPAPSLLRA